MHRNTTRPAIRYQPLSPAAKALIERLINRLGSK